MVKKPLFLGHFGGSGLGEMVSFADHDNVFQRDFHINVSIIELSSKSRYYRFADIGNYLPSHNELGLVLKLTVSIVFQRHQGRGKGRITLILVKD